MRKAATNKLKTSSLPDLTSASKLLYLREEKEKKTLPLHTHTHTHTHTRRARSCGRALAVPRTICSKLIASGR